MLEKRSHGEEKIIVSVLISYENLIPYELDVGAADHLDRVVDDFDALAAQTGMFLVF